MHSVILVGGFTLIFKETRKSSCVKTQEAYRLRHIMSVAFPAQAGGGARGLPCPGPGRGWVGYPVLVLPGGGVGGVPCPGPGQGVGQGMCTLSWSWLGGGPLSWSWLGGRGYLVLVLARGMGGGYPFLILAGGQGWGGMGVPCSGPG